MKTILEFLKYEWYVILMVTIAIVPFGWFIFLLGKISYEDYKQERSIENNPFPLNECSDNTYFCGHVFVPNGGYEIFYDCSVRSSEKGNLNTCIGYSGIRRTTAVFGNNNKLIYMKEGHHNISFSKFSAGYQLDSETLYNSWPKTTGHYLDCYPAYYNKHHGVAIGSGTIKIKEEK